MTRILTLFLCFHWMAVFAVLAALAAFGGAGLPASLGAMGIVPAGEPTRMPAGIECIVLGTGFGLVAVLFLWALASMVLGGQRSHAESDGITRLAFGGAVVMLTLVFVGCAVEPVSGHFRAVAVEIAALAGSYLVVAAERRMSAVGVGPFGEDVSATARVMALKAVHSILLARLTGRAAEKAGR